MPDGATVRLQFDAGDVTANIDHITLGGATFYVDANFAGVSRTLPKGQYTLAQLQAAGIPNDAISSLRVPNGWTVEAFQHDDFGGTRWVFTSDAINVGSGANDAISSVRIL